METAKPLKKAEVNKTKIWLLLCGGAAGLFALAVLAENNENLFPAIARANQAMQEYRGQKEGDSNDAQEQQQATSVPATATTPETVPEELSSTDDAVLRGMQAARERVSKKDERI